MYKEVVRPILFRMDAEDAHEWVIEGMQVVQAVPPLLWLARKLSGADLYPDPVDFCGIRFPGRVGLAAGFDKQGRVLPALQALGFNFIEVGTVLPFPQKGSPRPRIFRFPKHRAIINRMEFNSDGVVSVERNIKKHLPKLHIPIGMSLGKMRDTITSEQAANDYMLVLERLHGCGSYAVINVSSPNTLGLRALQKAAQAEYIVRRVVDKAAALARFGDPKIPILVKIDADFNDAEVPDVLSAIKNGGASGIIVANTTVNMPPELLKEHLETNGAGGGLSGKPAHKRALRRIELVRKFDHRIPLIGVGGIEDVFTMQDMFAVGADLIQLYTGFIYEGPGLVRRLREVLHDNRDNPLYHYQHRESPPPLTQCASA